ncbi:MAG: endonuclease domain-containing protein [bacterium]|nr:endonuclease domain-containing protein [bacterium]
MRDETPSVPPHAGGRGLGGGPARPFKPRNTARAKTLRNAAPTPERLLWQHQRNRKLGHKFSRQMPIGPYFADFLCRELGLIIELDGDSHDHTVDYDARRDDYCRAQGYQILRFSNADVMENLEGVVSHVKTTLAQAHPRPLPQAGGERIT